MGSIYLRGHTYWLKYYRNGKPYRESTRSDKETQAKNLLKKREGEIAIGKIPGVVFDKVRFESLVEDYYSDYRRRCRKSLERAEYSVMHLNKTFAGYRVTDITTPRINKHIEMRLAEKAKNATINRELAALKRMLNLGAQQTPPKVDRVPHIPMLKENNVRKGFFEDSEFQALRKALPSYLQGFVTFAYKTGWRVSEIEGLVWSQIDLDNGIVRLETGETKNNEGRMVHLDSELLTIFKNLWEYRKAKIGKRLFHDFRRTAVRNMVRAGIPERVSMMVSGHKTRSVFDRYNIVNDTDLKLASEKMETYLQAQRAQSGHNTGTVEVFNTEKVKVK